MPAIYGIYRNGGHLIKFYMQIMVHLPPTNLNLPSTYLAVARNSPPTPAQTEIVMFFSHFMLFPTFLEKIIWEYKTIISHLMFSSFFCMLEIFKSAPSLTATG